MSSSSAPPPEGPPALPLADPPASPPAPEPGAPLALLPRPTLFMGMAEAAPLRAAIVAADAPFKPFGLRSWTRQINIIFSATNGGTSETGSKSAVFSIQKMQQHLGRVVEATPWIQAGEEVWAVLDITGRNVSPVLIGTQEVRAYIEEHYVRGNAKKRDALKHVFNEKNESCPLTNKKKYSIYFDKSIAIIAYKKMEVPSEGSAE